MAEHNITLIFILAILIPITLSSIFVWLKYKYLKGSQKHALFDKILGVPLLIFFAMLISSPITYDYDESDLIQPLYQVEEILAWLLIFTQLVLYFRYIKAYYDSTDKVSTSVNALVLIGVLLLPLVLLAAVGVDFALVLLPLILIVISIVLAILVIATGIGLSPIMVDYINHRQLTSKDDLQIGQTIEALTNPPIKGKIIVLNASQITIEEGNKQYNLTPSKLRKQGYSIETPSK